MKIDHITLNNYRAFYNKPGEEGLRYNIDLKGGKNLLIYGENGSGKSSLFKALKDFFSSASDPNLIFEQNIFSEELALEEDPFIKVIFSNNADNPTYYFSSDRGRINTNVQVLRSAYKSRSFMSYRELMKIHFIDHEEVNLFDFLFGEGGLFAEMLNQAGSVQETKIPLSDLWKKICLDPDETLITDFNSGVLFQMTELSIYVNKLLAYFDLKMVVELSFSPVPTGVTPTAGKIELRVIYCGKAISQYHQFLNEARLSALAISLYLAAHLSVPRGQYNILFLDDIFTGLDTSNRVPLLKILSADVIAGTGSDTFRDHQIFLTTYDRQWFDLASHHLTNNWKSVEFFVEEFKLSETDQAIKVRPILIDPSLDYYHKALAHFERKDYPACANYQRKECERLIKLFLPDYCKFQASVSGEIVSITMLSSLFDKLKAYFREMDLDFSTFENFRNYIRVVMNPLSHDNLQSPAYRSELQEVFRLIDELRKLRNVIVMDVGADFKLSKKNIRTGHNHIFEFKLKSKLRRVNYDQQTKFSPVTMQPIKVQIIDGEKVNYERLNHDGLLPNVYKKICFSLGAAEGEMLDDFYIGEGVDRKTLKDIMV